MKVLECVLYQKHDSLYSEKEEDVKVFISVCLMLMNRTSGSGQILFSLFWERLLSGDVRQSPTPFLLLHNCFKSLFAE